MARSAAGVVGIAAIPILAWPFQDCSNHPAAACGCGCPSLPKEGSLFAEFHVGVEGTPRDLHPILRDEVYRIAGEALRNAFKHAKARRIVVEIRYDERQVFVPQFLKKHIRDKRK